MDIAEDVRNNAKFVMTLPPLSKDRMIQCIQEGREAYRGGTPCRKGPYSEPDQIRMDFYWMSGWEDERSIDEMTKKTSEDQ